jgi:tetratricopeptide (TPR) repeat protein
MIIRTVYVLRLILLLSLLSIFGVGCVTTSDHDQQVDVIIREAHSLRSSEKYREAAQVYAQALNQFPSDLRLCYNYAIALAEAGYDDESLNMLTKLHEDAKEGDYTYLIAAAGIASASGDTLTAQKYWQQILSEDPTHRVARKLYLHALIDQKEYEQAYSLALEAYELNQFEKDLFADLSFLAEQLGKPEATSWQIILDALDQ